MSHRRRRMRTTTSGLLALVLLALATPGCLRTPVKSPLMAQADDLVDVSSVQLRQRVYSFTARYANIV